MILSHSGKAGVVRLLLFLFLVLNFPFAVYGNEAI